MKTKTGKLFVALWLGFVTVVSINSLTGCAGDRYNRSTGEYIDDNSVKVRAWQALRDNPDYKFSNVNVTAFKGTVQLNGFVDLGAQKAMAEEIVRGVDGVHSVINNLSVGDPGPRTSGENADDKWLTSRVKSALAHSPDYKFDEVIVTTSKGTVQLSGFVNTTDQKSKAVDVAQAVPGVKDIQNSITVKDKM